jgi:hypothetical protein
LDCWLRVSWSFLDFKVQVQLWFMLVFLYTSMWLSCGLKELNLVTKLNVHQSASAGHSEIWSDRCGVLRWNGFPSRSQSVLTSSFEEIIMVPNLCSFGSCSSFLSIQSVLVFCSKTRTALVVMTPSPIFVIGNAA